MCLVILTMAMYRCRILVVLVEVTYITLCVINNLDWRTNLVFNNMIQYLQNMYECEWYKYVLYVRVQMNGECILLNNWTFLVKASDQSIINRQSILMQILLVSGLKIVLFTTEHTVTNFMSIHRRTTVPRIYLCEFSCYRLQLDNLLVMRWGE